MFSKKIRHGKVSMEDWTVVELKDEKSETIESHNSVIGLLRRVFLWIQVRLLIITAK